MITPTITLLPSGYWLVRWSQHRWVQWPRGERLTWVDAFGWVSTADMAEAERIASEEEAKRCEAT